MSKKCLSLLLLIPLCGCLCLPEGDESAMNTSYFGNCWQTAKQGPRNQVLFPKP